jgi:hypothetical protein
MREELLKMMMERLAERELRLPPFSFSLSLSSLALSF